MNFGVYPDLLRRDGVARTLLAALSSRTAVIMQAIPVSFLVKDLTGTFAWSGVVLGAYSIGAAIGTPLWSRRADRTSARNVLTLTGVGWGLCVVLMAFAGQLWFGSVLILALASGLLQPPTGPMLRTAWPRLVATRELRTAYSLDATAQELMFMVGPLAGATLVGVASPATALVLSGVVTIAGTAWFARQPVIDRPGRPVGDRLGVMETVLVRERLLILIAFCCAVVGLASVSLGIVAFAEHEHWRLLSGLLELIWAVGSFMGGLVAGALPGRRRSHAWRRAAIAAVIFAGCGFATSSPWLLAFGLFAAGSMIAPVMASASERLGALTTEAARAEVFGWMATAGTVGMAVGSALAGSVVEWAGVPWVFGLAALMLALAAVALLPIPPLEPDDLTTPGSSVDSRAPAS
ncbi:MFS transporter [Solicola gregarius]|uniref:MFS transporter n=1 Tax=Solicola gregarius TaxID=2908642 RepID=A0AA46TGY6_9ACTN|nr:MFS transporter [Solicola gregarius]UYM05167.1 MFS transporter [Solicola gregarius]